MNTKTIDNARIAIVHYWFASRRGGERVVEAMAKIFPNADIFALVVDPSVLSPDLQNRNIKTSFLQKIPGSRRWHRRFLPLLPIALEQFDLSDYDIVLSSESGPAKGVLTSSHTLHVCYCHSPMRYLWDFYHQYRRGHNFGILTRPFFAAAAHYLRLWDFASASRVDYFIANSCNVAQRIRKHYRRDSKVIFPPVDVHAGYLSEETEDYYLAVGHLVDYKRFDLAITACTRLGRRLHIVGDGEQYRRLRRMAGPSVKFLGSLPDKELQSQYARCRALLFPGEEDFGIVPVEALSFGRPVIGFACGGLLETVRGFFPDSISVPELSSGVFFREQTTESLIEAIKAFEAIENKFSPVFIKRQAERFDQSVFKEKLAGFLSEKWNLFQESLLRHGQQEMPGNFSERDNKIVRHLQEVSN